MKSEKEGKGKGLGELCPLLLGRSVHAGLTIITYSTYVCESLVCVCVSCVIMHVACVCACVCACAYELLVVVCVCC